MALSRIDQIILAELIGNEELGQYAVAVKLVDLWQFLPLAIISSVFPSIIKGKEIGQESFKKRVTYLYSMMFWLSFTFAVSVSILGKPLVSTHYGASYDKAGYLLICYAWPTIFTFFTFARMKVFVVEHALTSGVLIGIITLVINVISNFILIPILKAYGAVLSLLIAHFVANLLMSIFDKSTRQSCLYLMQSTYFPIKKIIQKTRP